MVDSLEVIAACDLEVDRYSKLNELMSYMSYMTSVNYQNKHFVVRNHSVICYQVLYVLCLY